MTSDERRPLLARGCATGNHDAQRLNSAAAEGGRLE